MKLQSINPATESLIAEYETHSTDRVRATIVRAQEALASWRTETLARRCELLMEVARELRARQARCAATITAEMGKPVQQALAEVAKTAITCEYYARNASRFLANSPIASDAAESYVRYDPLGVVLAIMPWNFPFWQVFRCAAPALVAGNVVLLKHASNVPGCALAIEELFAGAGFPPGVFGTLLIDSDQARQVIADDAIAAISLTGSDAAGTAVATHAGAQLKKCVLELGGSDAFIVLADADVALAARQAVAARCQNAGQSCIAAKRFIVEAAVAEQFTDEMIAHVARLKVGDPTDPATDVGPLARADLRDELHALVRRSVEAGARVRAGGEIPAGRGFFYPPTILDRVDRRMPVFAEETFGPVAPVVSARDADEAIAIANDSRFGLGASIWTRDVPRGAALAGEIEAGSVFVNEVVKSDPRLPFGGVKRSGYGRELAEFGIREFVNVKSVWIG